VYGFSYSVFIELMENTVNCSRSSVCDDSTSQ